MTPDYSNVDLPSTEEEDPRLQLLEDIADGILVLSQASETPTGVSPSPAALAKPDPGHDEDACIWLLNEVQGWLYFENELPMRNREAYLSQLIAELGLGLSEGIDSSSVTPRLAICALERLNQRIEVATRLQQFFASQLESEGANRATATESWTRAWDDESDMVEPISPDPVTAVADVLPISELTDSELNLTPSYQRGDVWKTRDRQALIESILRGIPLPSIILLETGPENPIEVVDGKQRLTSILRFVGKHPVALEKIDELDAKYPEHGLRRLFYEDYPRFRAKWRALEGSPLSAKLEDEYYFPFKLRNNAEGGLVGPELELLQGRYYTQIRDQIIKVANTRMAIRTLFERTTDYKVPVIKYRQATQQQIHEVFRLYNKQGVHLNAEEIRNAIYHEVELTRATLVASGDADPRASVDSIARSLRVVPELDELGETLRGYGFGDSRYKRTKLLSWVISILVRGTDTGVLSTARHIDQLLTEIQRQPVHPLRDETALGSLFTWVAQSVNLHASYDELWSEEFMDGGKGAKWQELQLVGSLVGMAFALAGAPDDIEERIERAADRVRSATRTWHRPAKTQTRTQWEYIARITTSLLELLGVDSEFASAEVKRRFGASGLESLQRLIQATAG